MKDDIHDNTDFFEKSLKRDRAEFPTRAIEALFEMKPGIRRAIAALRVLPSLLRMARRTLAGRWRSPINPAPGSIVIVHASPGGFISGWYSDGKWWTNDHVPDGTFFGSHVTREINVIGWRFCEGSLAEPWHEDWRPPRVTD